MSIPFFKYQGTGNDFIIIDARTQEYTQLNVAGMCDRRFGIGADGLMLLKLCKGFDFEMVYYNSDGRTSSMCGNGGRCIAKFAHSVGLGTQGVLQFLAVDGPHEAVILGKDVRLQMSEVNACEVRSNKVAVLNTGSPHFVQFTECNPDEEDLNSIAKAIRYGAEFAAEGINVNLVKVLGEGRLKMRTYERGVEDETYSCGTGVTAAAIAYNQLFNNECGKVEIHTPGGGLVVEFERTQNGWKNIFLTGPAEQVFTGVWP